MDASTGSELTSRVVQAVKVVEGEPDGALFEIPAYKERSPSEILQLSAGLKNSPSNAETGELLDKAYQHAKSH